MKAFKRSQVQPSVLAFIVLASSLIFIGCGPQTIGPTEDSLSSTSTSPSDSNVLLCSQGSGNSAVMNLKLVTQASGLRNDLVGVRMLNVPETFTATATNELQFFAEKFSSSNVSIANTRTTFYLMDSSTGKYLNSNGYQGLKWSDMKSIYNATFGGAVITTVAQFFAKFNLIVDIADTSSSTKLLRAFIFENLNAAPTREIKALIPRFLANPEEYKKVSSNTLYSLHPLKGQSFGTTAEYVQKANEFCF